MPRSFDIELDKISEFYQVFNITFCAVHVSSKMNDDNKKRVRLRPLNAEKHSRSELSWAIRQAGEERVRLEQTLIVTVGSSSSRRCTDNLKQLHGSSPLQ